MGRLSFYNPVYLWGLLFLLVPLILHLLNRRKTVAFDFSTVRFLQNTAIHASKQQRLRRLLLLISRMGIVTVLTIIFAGPYDRGNPFAILSDPQAEADCWIDPTLSMDYRDNERSLWECALACADSLDAGMARTARRTRYNPLSGDFGTPFRLPSDSTGFVRPGASGIEDMLNAFARRTAIRKSPHFLVVMSDFQSPVAAGFEQWILRQQSTAPVLLVWTRPRDPWNFSVLDAHTAADNPGLLDVRVAAHGRSLQNGTVEALIARTRIGYAAVSLKPDSSVDLSFPISRDRAEGAGSIRLLTADPYRHDNSCYFAGQARQVFQVLIVGDTARCAPLRAAFAALGPAHGWGRPRMRSAMSISRDDLDSADLIVCNEIDEPSSAVLSLLTEKSYEGKAILMAPAMDPTRAEANAGFFMRLGAANKPVFQASANPVVPVIRDTLAALWQGFPRLRDAHAQINRWITGLPGKPLLLMSNAAPLATLSVCPNGAACCILATALGISDANTISETGFFVPLIDRLAHHAMAAVRLDSQPWIAGLPHRNPVYGSGSPATLFDAEGRITGVWESQSTVFVERPGLYRLQPKNSPAMQIAVGVDSTESAFNYRPPEIPAGKRHMAKLIPAEDFPRFVSGRHASFFQYGLWILLSLFAAAEMLLWGAFRQGGRHHRLREK